MKTPRAACLALALLGSVVLNGSAFAGWSSCFNSSAVADIIGGTTGDLSSSHFGEVTSTPSNSLGCLAPPKTHLRGRVLLNGAILTTKEDDGPKPALGIYIQFTTDPIVTCHDSWRATSEFGVVTGLGLDVTASATSGIVTATCPNHGGGGGGCGLTLSSSTFRLGRESERTHQHGPSPMSFSADSAADAWRLADHQLGFGLSRSEERPEGSFFLDEWAILSFRDRVGIVTLASSEEFKNRVQEAAEDYRSDANDSGSVLIFEDAEHEHNSRQIPMPTLSPMNLDLGNGGSQSAEEVWFRAEISAEDRVDRFTLLESFGSKEADRIQTALVDNLRLEYADSRRHRVAVLGVARLSSDGHLSLGSVTLNLMKCCCGGIHCV